MVSLLRKPIGFAFIYVVLATLLVMYFDTDIHQRGMESFINTGALLALFTIIYVLFVKAHLSNHFRLYASIYIALLKLLIMIGWLALMDINQIMKALLTNYQIWVFAALQFVIPFVISYVVITIGNWLASFALKTKGHI